MGETPANVSEQKERTGDVNTVSGDVNALSADAARKENAPQVPSGMAQRESLEREIVGKAAESGVDTDLETDGTDEASTPPDQAEEKKSETLFGSFLAALVSAKDGILDFLGKMGISLRTRLEKFFGAEKGADPDPDEDTDTDGELDTNFTVSRDLLERAEATLKRKIDPERGERSDWLVYAREAGREYEVAPEIIFAIIHFETGGKYGINAKNPNSSAEGLGQFTDATWARFIQENPPFKGLDQSDDEASFYATAWYCRQNADELEIDLSAPDAALKLYEAHHCGAGGYEKLQEFRKTGVEFEIPRSYLKNPHYPSFAVPTLKTCTDYSKLVHNMAAKVQAISDQFAVTLRAYPTPEPVS